MDFGAVEEAGKAPVDGALIQQVLADEHDGGGQLEVAVTLLGEAVAFIRGQQIPNRHAVRARAMKYPRLRILLLGIALSAGKRDLQPLRRRGALQVTT